MIFIIPTTKHTDIKFCGRAHTCVCMKYNLCWWNNAAELIYGKLNFSSHSVCVCLLLPLLFPTNVFVYCGRNRLYIIIVIWMNHNPLCVDFHFARSCIQFFLLFWNNNCYWHFPHSSTHSFKCLVSLNEWELCK
jgi:hypothetical protein